MVPRRALPPSGASSPSIILSRVVLLAPLADQPTLSPRRMVPLKSLIT
ncbi:hypothetical protein [Duganella sp. BJB1802]|nr:hypothetical protein [Duganella sp. BJB1802]